MRVAVIGAGVAGLTTATVLRERGVDAEIVAESTETGLASVRAGAVFSPFRIDGHPRSAQWTKAAYARLTQLAQIGSRTGVERCTLHEYFAEHLASPPWWGAVVDDFARIEPVPTAYGDAYRATVPKMDMRLYLPWLRQNFTQGLGGRIRIAVVDAFEQLLANGYDLVVNCSGLGARRLASDPAVDAMRGQIVHAANPFGLKDAWVEESKGATATYVFSFDEYVVLGGTYERGLWEETTEAAALDAIVERCRSLLERCGVRGIETLGDVRLRTFAGLRPARVVEGVDEAVRLERDGSAAGRVIHNYGHGRAGVTLSWGCAEDVAELVASNC